MKNKISIITTTPTIEGFEILEYLGVLYWWRSNWESFSDSDANKTGWVVESRTMETKDPKAFIEDRILKPYEQIALVGLDVRLEETHGVKTKIYGRSGTSAIALQYGTLVKVKRKIKELS